MPRYSAVWLEISRAQHQTCPHEVRSQIDAKIQRLLENPQAYGTYDQTTDQWTATYGGGTGLIVYAIVQHYFKIIILRLV